MRDLQRTPMPQQNPLLAKLPAEAQRILIADDDISSADIAALLLKHLGHDVIQVYGGHAALEVALEYEPDIVILDIGMPGLHGLDVAKALRDFPEPVRNCRLIAYTGHAGRHMRETAVAAGFDDYLVKPVSLERWESALKHP